MSKFSAWKWPSSTAICVPEEGYTLPSLSLDRFTSRILFQDRIFQDRSWANNCAAEYISRIHIPVTQPFAVCLAEVSGSIQSGSLGRLEPWLQKTVSYMTGKILKQTNPDERRKIRRRIKSYMCCVDKLLRRVKGIFRVIPRFQSDKLFCKRDYHDYIGHWDKESTRHFISTRFQWPNIHRKIQKYVKTCDKGQTFAPLTE